MAALSVEISELWAGYNGHPILQDINLKITAGDFVGIIGPNGCGKSTLLKVILGLVKPSQGSVAVGGQPPQKVRKRIGYLPQLTQIDFNFPATVWDVVLMGRYGKLGLGHVPSTLDKSAVEAALHRVGISDLSKTPIGELSGGQRQRTFIARAICQEPDLLILDEPITGVDITTQHALSHLLEELNKQGITIITTTHDLNCVASSFNHVVCLNKKLIASGTPQEVLTQDILNDTFGSHLLMHTVGQQLVVMHGHIESEEHQAHRGT